MLIAGVVSAVTISRSQERQQAREQAQEQAQLEKHRAAVTALLADVEFVLEPLFLASTYDGQAGEQVRTDVYRYGDVARDVEHVRAELGRLPASGTPSGTLTAAVDARLLDAAEAARRLALFDHGPVDWATDLAAISTSRDGWLQALRDSTPGREPALPSLASSALTATRASSVLRFDAVCDSALYRLPDASQPQTPRQLATVVEELATSLSLAAGGLLGVEVPGYEQTYVDSNVRLPARTLRERLDPAATAVREAADAGDVTALRRAFEEFVRLQDVSTEIGTGLVTYGAHVCAEYFDVPLPEAATPPGATEGSSRT